MKRIVSSCSFGAFASLIAAVLLLAACQGSKPRAASEKDATVAIAMAGSINTTPEDGVEQVRVIVSQSSTGVVVYNDIIQWQGAMNTPSKAIKLKEGRYNFYFIANEQRDGGSMSLTDWLSKIANTTVLLQSEVFPLTYKQGCSLQQGDRFLRTAIKRDVEVTGQSDEN